MQKETLSQTITSFYKSLSLVTLPADSISFTPLGKETVKEGCQKGIPLLKLCPPQVKASDFFNLLETTSKIITEHYPHLATECEQIHSALPVAETNRELFAAKVFTPGENLLADLKGDISSETFGFLLTHTVKPFMQKFSQATLGIYDLEEWLKGFCPVCGSKPSFSLLEKEKGRRYLYCGLCEIKWRFQRLGCPYCLNPESQFFAITGEEKYRVYYCENCRGYLKTVDEKMVTGKIDLFWEDIHTVHLDILAIQEGYLNMHVSNNSYLTWDKTDKAAGIFFSDKE